MKKLDVYLNQNLVGQLNQDKHGQMNFEYDESWLENPYARPLSHSLPLRKQNYNQKQCRAYFIGLLPEENQRELIARNLGISARNDFSLLEKIGGECAGAVTFLQHSQPYPKESQQYKCISEVELTNILEELPKRPLLAGVDGIRLSLAGVQDKLAILLMQDKIAIPQDSSPSTYILKPRNPYFEGLITNENLCMRLAELIGIPTAKTEVRNLKGTTYLLIERFDRKIIQSSTPFPKINRLHQEDFCQALGILSTIKYQNEGGPSLKQCFNLIREISSTPVLDLQHLLDAVIYNFIIGNHDAHGKNFSILYEEIDGQQKIKLAPLYDLVSTFYYPELSKKMAMKIGGEYSSERINSSHFERMAEESEMAKPLVKKRVLEITEKTLANLPSFVKNDLTAEQLTQLIKKRCERILLDFQRL